MILLDADKIDGQHRRRTQWDDLMTLCELGNEAEDESLIPEVEEGFAALEASSSRAGRRLFSFTLYSSNCSIDLSTHFYKIAFYYSQSFSRCKVPRRGWRNFFPGENPLKGTAGLC